MIIAWSIIIHFVVEVCVSVDIIRKHSYQICEIPHLPKMSIDHRTTFSKLDCATQCSSDEHCVTFRYDNSSYACFTEGELMVAPGQIYTRPIRSGGCPTDVGYKEYGWAPNILCLKNYTFKMPHASATKLCSCHGAHLVLIEDASMFTVVKNLASQHNWGNVWVDAFDPDDTKNYITHKGEAIPFIPPSKALGDVDSQCIRLYIVNGTASFQDVGCGAYKWVLCQFDV